MIQEQFDRWSGLFDQINIAPLTGLSINEYDLSSKTYTRNATRKGGDKPFILLHCYKELVGNEKWVRGTSTPHQRGHGLAYPLKPVTRRIKILIKGWIGQKIAKKRDKHGDIDAYK